MGNPPTKPDGSVTNTTSPVPAVPENAALVTSAAADRRLPPVVTARDQAKAAGAN
jgi:hypothetical protein